MTTGFDKWKSVEWRNKPKKKQLHPVSRGYHYKLDKKCLNCGMAIIDQNTTGYCAKCYPFMRVKGEGNGQGESLEHQELKMKAKRWLQEMGCKHIQSECKCLGKRGEVRFDVAGFRDKLLIAVECGGSQPGKLNKVLGITEELYIWPYGSSEPYKYNKGMKVCTSCGHLKSEKTPSVHP